MPTMNDITHQPLADVPFYQGPHAIEGIRFFGVAAALGVSAWGMNVLELAPNNEGHPDHDHAKDGQEEVYVVLSGSAELRTAEGITALSQHDFVRVGPKVKRKLIAGNEGATVLAIGGTPGKAYEADPRLAKNDA